MVKKIRTHLMFDGNALEAMDLYISLFPSSSIVEKTLFAEGDHVGKLQLGVFQLAGQEFLCIDTPVSHDFDFTSAMSIFVDFTTEEELVKVFEALAEGGNILMPLANYGFSPKFGWLQDRFGVSWQLNLEPTV